MPQEFTKIQTLFSTLQEPANDAYNCMVATTQMQQKFKRLKDLLIKGCNSHFHPGIKTCDRNGCHAP